MIITEQDLRLQLKDYTEDSYHLPEGGVLTPSAMDYLKHRRLNIIREKSKVHPPVSKRDREVPKVASEPTPETQVVVEQPAEQQAEPATQVTPAKLPKYTDYLSGASYDQKPEHMTQMVGNQLVCKNHPRIAFRGKMDSLQAMLVLAQVLLVEEDKTSRLVYDLDDIYRQLNLVMRCDVMDEPCESSHIIGLSHEELRDRSHHPMKYFKIKQLLLANYTMGKAHALLNQIRAGIREAEVMAVSAFQEGNKHTRLDIVQHLNRLSSALHIMCCMYLSGMYHEQVEQTP